MPYQPPPGGGSTFTGPKSGSDIPIPPPADDKSKTAQEKFRKWVTSIGATPKQANDMWFWGKKYNLDPYYWASVVKNESNFKNDADSGQAVGFGQIAWSWVGKKIKWKESGKTITITRENLLDPGWNLRFSAQLLTEAVASYGYDRAYLDGYNPNDPNREAAWVKIQATHKTSKQQWPSPSGGPGPTPPVPGDNTTGNDDPWVTGVSKGKNGKLSTSSSLEPPKNALKWDGLPVRRSDFLRLKRQMEETYVSYTGKRPSDMQIQQFIEKGWSVYKLTDLLSAGPNFTKSPLWKSKAPVYQAAAKNLIGPNEKADQAMIRRAVVNNWSPDTFQAELRKRKGYVQSNEFKGQSATMSNVYQSIYGTPSLGAKKMIGEAALAGWSPDQFAAWLRSRDEYVYTPEYRAKATSLVEALGFMMGSVATLGKPQGAAPDLPNPGAIPNDPRIPGTGTPVQGPPLVPGVQR